MTQKFIYHMHNLCKKIGSKTILENINLSFYHGAKIGVVGVNGSGKSTLLRIMASLDQEFSGESFLEKNATLGYLPQEPVLDETLNVKDNILQGLSHIKEKLEEFEKISLELAENYTDELMEKMGDLQSEIDKYDGWTIDNQVEIAQEALRCPEGDAMVKNLSGGEKRRVALAKLLLSKPDLLLLDEPTNHLDAETVAWLEHYLKNYFGSVIIVTHDRYFLDNITGWVLELDKGKGIPFEGNYSKWLENKEKLISADNKSQSKMDKIIKRELEWIRSTPKAKQTKAKSRINSFSVLVDEVQKDKSAISQIYIPVEKRLGSKVLEVEDLSKSYGDKLLIENLSFSVPPGAIIGIIGANGAGKSTLFKMITGHDKDFTGNITLGETVDLGYVSQDRDELDDKKTIYQEISQGNDLLKLGNKEINARAYCSYYNFKAGDQQKMVKDLSGGERNRVQMAKMLQRGANLLLLDEPTNDLDVETLRNLEDAILNFPGSAMVISHDRWFLDRIATHILAFEGNSHVEFFAGDYSSYREDKILRTGSNDEVPKKLKYKKLNR